MKGQVFYYPLSKRFTMKAKSASILKYLLIALSFIVLNSTVKAQLKADFSSNITKGCAPIIVQFRDSSSGNPTSWKWDLGNGTISFLQNPSVSYINPGVYNIKLVIKKGNQEDSITKSQFITVYDLPNVEFTASNRGGCYPLKTQFTDLSTSNNSIITNWLWDFGDGNTSTQQNPFYTYNNDGNFSVKLKVTNSNGCFKVIGKNSYITVQGGVHANFTYASAGTCAPPTPVNFTNTSTSSGGLTYQWFFGDNGVATDANPTHNYTANGSYTVTLVAINSAGCKDTMVKANAVNVGTVHANFNLPQTTICAGAPLAINNTSTPATVGSTWSFGNGTVSNLINPTISYNVAGTYSIKLVNSFGSCIDSIEKSITVLPKPSAQFSAINNIGCTAPLQVQFVNNSTGGVSYYWEFGDGNNSNLQNPTYTYLNSGDYNIKLVILGGNGCSDSLVKSNYVSMRPPKIQAIMNDPKEGCVPLPVAFQSVISSTQNIATYEWNFGDGTTSTDSVPSHTYATEGVFSVKLKITTVGGCTDTLTLVDAVKAGHKPKAEFDASPRISCPDAPVKFTDLSTNGPIDKWKWQFGDGNGSPVQNPSNSYKDTGYMNVKLIVWSNGCSDTIVKAKYVFINPPVAKFGIQTDCSTRMKVSFTDSSIMPTSYNWDFGDGNSSTQANPVHTYSSAGVYSVMLTVANGVCTSKKMHIVAVDDKVGILKITDVACRNEPVSFLVDSVSAVNPPVSYDWYFSINTLYGYLYNNFSTRYPIAGHFPASVVVHYENGCQDSLVSAVGITIHGAKPNFKSLLNQYCKSSVINFTDSSTTDGIHPISKWIWNYGDGNIDTLTSAPFSHSYTTGGNYNVQLTVVDSYGCIDSVYKPSAVKVSQLQASFVSSDTLVCPSTSVQFTNNSVGANITYNWSLGDGATSTSDTTITHAYASQNTYTIKLAVKDAIGCTDTLSKVLDVYKPTANFIMSDSTAVCPPLLVNLTNQSQHSGTYNWDFDDNGFSINTDASHLYTYPGTYNVKLVAVNKGGCSDSLIRTVKIYGPTGTLSYSPILGCVPLQVNFSATTNNTVKNTWDFDNGVTNTGTVNSTSYTYTLHGDYIPKLILEDAQGCKVAVKGIDTVKVKYVAAQFTKPTLPFCDSALAYFTSTSATNDVIASHVWSFGDGTIVNGNNLTNHHYASTGLYGVKLKVTTQTGCIDSILVADAVKIVPTPKAAIKSDTAVCKNEYLQFSASLVNADTSAISWYWSFGNGNTSTLQNPPAQQYLNAGSYTLINKVTNSSGCESLITKNITVHALPIFSVGPDTTICRNQSVILNANGANSYIWSGNISTLSCVTCASPIAKPLTNITYVVTGKNGFNCISTDTVNVIVKQPSKLNVIKGDTLCLGETLTVKATGTELYNWYPNIYLDNTNTNTVNIRPTKDTLVKYMLIGKDDRNCFRDTAYVSIKTYPIPKFDILQSSLTLNAGTQVNLQTNNSADITSWKWYPSKFLDNPTRSNPVLTAKEDVTYICVAENDGHCSAKDEVKVIVICNGGNVFLPNTFSPNGDGHNDIFYPRGRGIYGVKSFRVFNRWGEMVFERTNFNANDISSGWDGTYKGVKLPADAYVYTVELMCDNNNTIPAKGSITLLR